ncbi:FAD-dependent oxidoreductase [Streptomyces sp. NBC_01317]|uniref:FAD-dependent oxidoreductase n=1 Tax=Streptomyces sp. NBC_01317 TaxID=2903822 RepID=UPI002E113C82|nr:FAD-dependent oxidoreductase [Streptomyces sp. NBC_01317]
MTRSYDVVVAGAGMAGILTALGLTARGARVLLVEERRLGGGQSGQSHGYLHRGYAFGPNEPRLPLLFDRARDHWLALTAGLAPVTAGSVVSFSNPNALRRAQEHWQASGLPVRPVEPPPWLGDGFISSFRSEEETYDFGPVLRRLGERTASSGIDLARGSISRTADEPGGVLCELVRPDGLTETIASRAVVVAAGAGAPGILARSGLPPVVRCRKSFMLVLRGNLPVISAVFPEREEHGLFVAGRTGHEGGTTWLVSDFQSFDSARGAGGQLAGWWAHRVLSTLRGVVRPGPLAGVRLISGYAAVKSGLLPSSGTVADEFSHDFLGGRAVVVSPSKLTLAPLAAESAVKSVSGVLGIPFTGVEWDRVTAPVPPPVSPAGSPSVSTPLSTPPSPPGPAAADSVLLTSAGELWETDLHALKDPDLLGDLPGIAALSSLYAH